MDGWMNGWMDGIRMAFKNEYKKWVNNYIDEGLAREDVTNMAPDMPR